MNAFISYSRHSADVTKPLAEDIKSLGHAAWYDQELGGGQAWWAQILEKIRGCDVFVFVLDPASLNSTACTREWNYAAALGKPILPVLVSDDISTNLLPPALSRIQFVDYRTQDRDAVIRLARAFATLPPAEPLPDPLPSPPETPVSYLGTLTEKVGTVSTLSYDEQCSLLTDLRRALRDPETAHDARALLVTLRHRRELFASIAEEIDELLSGLPPEGGERATAEEVTTTEISSQQQTETLTPDQGKQPETSDVELAGTTAAPKKQKSRVVPIVAIAVAAVVLLGAGGYGVSRLLAAGDDEGKQTEEEIPPEEEPATADMPTYREVVATYPEGASTVDLEANITGSEEYEDGMYTLDFVGESAGVEVSGYLYLEGDKYDSVPPPGVVWMQYADEAPPYDDAMTEEEYQAGYDAWIAALKSADATFAALYGAAESTMLGPKFTSDISGTFGELDVSPGDLLTFDSSMRLVKVSGW